MMTPKLPALAVRPEAIKDASWSLCTLPEHLAGLVAGEYLQSLVVTSELLRAEEGVLAPLICLRVACCLGLVEELGVLLHLKRGALELLRGVGEPLVRLALLGFIGLQDGLQGAELLGLDAHEINKFLWDVASD